MTARYPDSPMVARRQQRLVSAWYRLRPVPWPALAGTAVIVTGGASWLARHQEPSSGATLAVQFLGLILGLNLAFALSAEIDPPLPLLRAVPGRYRRTVALRAAVIGLAALAAATIACASPVGAAGPLIVAAAARLLLSAALALLLGGLAGSYAGAGLAAAVLLGLQVAAAALQPHDPVMPLSPAGASAGLYAAGLATCLIAAWLTRRAS